MKNESFVPRKPDYNLKYRDIKNPENEGLIGKAWINKDGHISLHLNPLVVLKESDKFQLTLFLNTQVKSE